MGSLVLRCFQSGRVPPAGGILGENHVEHVEQMWNKQPYAFSGGIGFGRLGVVICD